MPKYFLSLILTFGLFSCSSEIINGSFNIEPAVQFPQWLVVNDYSTDQTSGIAFLNKDSAGNKNFIIADDVGKIHRLKIIDDSVSEIKPVFFSDAAASFLSEFPKPDFEEIIFDKHDGNIYLSIEGNGPSAAEYAGIFRLVFSGNNIWADTITLFEKLNIIPDSVFKKYLNWNIAYEGFASDENYFYLGLEGFSANGLFADSSVIFVVKKSSLEIIKEISTKEFGIHTICGLYSDQNGSLFGIDRNNKKLFHLSLNEHLDITGTSLINIKTHIPNYAAFDYVSSLESLTMDDESNLYLIDDPWKTFFIPSDEILNQLDEKTINNFKNYIPVLYKFKLKN